MEQIIYVILYAFVLVSSLLYIWHKLLNKKIYFKDEKLYVTLFSIIIIAIFNYFLVNKFIKIVIITLVFMIFFRYLFKEKVQKCIITPIFYQLIIMISETIYAVVLIYVFKNDANSIINTYFGDFLSNIIISIISVIIVNIKFVGHLYNKIINATDRINNYKLSVFSLFIIIISNIFAAIAYYRIKFEFIIVFNALITIICYCIVLYSFKTQNNYKKVSDKYNIAINSLKDYEDMMTKYRIANHENKNLLLTIRAMILNNENNIPEYINSIVEEKYVDSEKLLFKMSVIPSGGLRATIYSEILKIRENKINYILDIDNKLKTIELIELDTNTVIDACKIIGVFIDNAIEEVKKQKANNRNIGINLYVEENYLNIKIANTYASKIEIDKIFNKGYTTKGQGHGYGLTLVKQIVENTDKFCNEVEIGKNIFSQILKIKLK